MIETLDRMYADIFESRGVVSGESLPGLSPAGACFRMLPEKGDGYAWVYHVSPRVTITILGGLWRGANGNDLWLDIRPLFDFALGGQAV